MRVWSLGQEDPLEEGMATHSSVLAWEIPWTEERGGLQSTGSQRVRHRWSDLACMQAFLLSRESKFHRTRNLFLNVLICTLSLFISVSLGLRCRKRGLLTLRFGEQISPCSGFSCCRAQALGTQSPVFRHTGSVVVGQGLSCSTACGIFPEQGLNLCPLLRQADSYPLHHQGSPRPDIVTVLIALLS